MLTQLADVARGAGLKVREVDGWRTRGRPGSFAPVGVLWHHTATGPTVRDDVVQRLLVIGRSDLSGPLAQLGLERDGTVVVIAAGRANHGGVARASGTVGAGDANALYIGIEAYNSGVGEPWPQAQYDAYVRLTAALCQHVTGNSAQTVRGHRETSVTGKIDPAGIDMDRARARVAATIEGEQDDMADEKTQQTLGSILANTERLLEQTRVDREADRRNRQEVRGRLRTLAQAVRRRSTKDQADGLAEDLDKLADALDEAS